MSASVKPQEPSMEEILASIRRIIADDQGRMGHEDVSSAPAEPDTDAEPRVAEFPPPPVRLYSEDERFDAAREVLRHAHELTDQGPAADPQGFEEDERLVSSETDASVSQAFNALAHTVLSSNPRPVEDIVREMLRPMLRTWLDDNLPTIVERLVRAEIERVARGGR